MWKRVVAQALKGRHLVYALSALFELNLTATVWRLRRARGMPDGALYQQLAALRI